MSKTRGCGVIIIDDNNKILMGQRVIKELNDAGYVVEKIEDTFPGVSSICIKW